jgi:2,3-bisphosphoglycerate-dependent phosphoglycerate mutase
MQNKNTKTTSASCFHSAFCILHSALKYPLPGRRADLRRDTLEEVVFSQKINRVPIEKRIMPTRVLLLRHAETANPLIFHGAESDVGLSERGRRQAAAIAPLLAAHAPQVLVSSAMRRAIDTATPIGPACGLELRIEPELHERRVGSLGGTPTRVREGVWPDTLRRWLAGDTAFAPPGAESYDDIRRRVLPVWQRLTSTFANQTLVIVAHGIVCRVLLLSLLPEYTIRDWHRIRTDNVAINELIYESETWRALRINELPAEMPDID